MFTKPKWRYLQELSYGFYKIYNTKAQLSLRLDFFLLQVDSSDHVRFRSNVFWFICSKRQRSTTPLCPARQLSHQETVVLSQGVFGQHQINILYKRIPPKNRLTRHHKGTVTSILHQRSSSSILPANSPMPDDLFLGEEVWNIAKMYSFEKTRNKYNCLTSISICKTSYRDFFNKFVLFIQ